MPPLDAAKYTQAPLDEHFLGVAAVRPLEQCDKDGIRLAEPAEFRLREGSPETAMRAFSLSAPTSEE